MSDVLYFEDLEVGARWSSSARTITEADIVNFACLTGDFDPLHVDHEFAKETPYGKPLAHGLLGLSYLAGLSSQCPAVRTSAFSSIRQWQFLAPIFVGDTVRSDGSRRVAAEGPSRGLVVWNRQLVNQNGQTVQSGSLETLVAVRDPRALRRDARPQTIKMHSSQDRETRRFAA